MSRRTNRRQFIQQTGLAGLGFWVAGGLTAAISRSPNEKLSIAGIGVGGKGDSDINQAGKVGNVVALCDIDDHTLDRKAGEFPKAKKFNDFRKMLEEMGKSIDAVTVSTPDHTHAAAAMMAMKMGKHVYCQKPLTHTVREARELRLAARKYKVCTQMGNQGSAGNGLRQGVEIIQAGALGPVREVHVWTDRPIWPQGADAIFRAPGVREAALAALQGRTPSSPPSAQSPPKHVHWDLWLGPAPERRYAPIYHPFAWRGWWDFGTGALGDMACHTANLAFRALKLGYPSSIQAENGDINPQTYPTWATITFQFPARGDMPPLKFVWYEGQKGYQKNLPRGGGRRRRSSEQDLFHGEMPTGSGSLIVGDKGVLYSPDDYGGNYKLLPKKNFEGFKPPEPTLPRNGRGDDGMKEEWVRAIMENKPEIAYSNFDFAGLLTETILLGNVAMRAGKKLEWDGENMKFTNAPDAEKFLHCEYRNGWTL
ncbi:MAG: Gfo/Idh/MocA family protein [Gemmataceae bacterium]